jgi:DNA-binding NtrC family response regulator
MTTAEQGTSRRVLLVEDEYFIADDMAQAFEAKGLHVIGPVGTLQEAMGLIENDGPIDGAVLDINLRGEMAFPLAVALYERGVPFIFATGYDRGVVPERFADVKHCEKPIDASLVTRSLFG